MVTFHLKLILYTLLLHAIVYVLALTPSPSVLPSGQNLNIALGGSTASSSVLYVGPPGGCNVTLKIVGGGGGGSGYSSTSGTGGGGAQFLYVTFYFF
jgi:hypothetical protein